MARYSEKTPIINSLLKFILTTGLIGTALVAPNALLAFDKPLKKYYKKLDKIERQREYRALLGYLRKSGLINYNANFNGIKLTANGIKRAEKANLDNISIAKPSNWDNRWRLVFFDIPEKNKTARDALSRKLKDIGFLQLQKSVWIHPFPCREEIATITEQLQIRQYVTYIETSHIDSHDQLVKMFQSYF